MIGVPADRLRPAGLEGAPRRVVEHVAGGPMTPAHLPDGLLGEDGIDRRADLIQRSNVAGGRQPEPIAEASRGMQFERELGSARAGRTVAPKHSPAWSQRRNGLRRRSSLPSPRNLETRTHPRPRRDEPFHIVVRAFQPQSASAEIGRRRDPPGSASAAARPTAVGSAAPTNAGAVVDAPTPVMRVAHVRVAGPRNSAGEQGPQIRAIDLGHVRRTTRRLLMGSDLEPRRSDRSEGLTNRRPAQRQGTRATRPRSCERQSRTARCVFGTPECIDRAEHCGLSDVTA